MSKIGIIGLGNVGKNYCYSLINKKACDEIVLIDTNEEVLKGNYLDLLDSSILSNIKIIIGEYSDLSDADLIVITAGKNQEKGESRLDLISHNKEIIKSICDNINETNFNGIVLVATNPLDVCTYLVSKYINLPANKVIGSGAFLDTIRLKRILSKKYNTKNIKTFVIGEHGDSSVVVWSKTYIDDKLINITKEEKSKIEDELHNVAYNIINLKGETSFGISTVLEYITSLILNKKSEEVIVSSIINNISISNLFTINSDGVKLVNIDLSEEELIKYNNSIKVINETINSLED